MVKRTLASTAHARSCDGRQLRVNSVKSGQQALEKQLEARAFQRALVFCHKRRLHGTAAFVSEHHEQLR